MTLTEQRVLKIEFEVGTLPQGNFLPRSAAADLDRWSAFTLQNRTQTLTNRLDRLGLTPVVEWARDTTRRRLESPLMASEGHLELAADPSHLTLAELAYLYDALVRLHSKSPTEELAARTGLTTAAARNKIYRARQKGLLSATKPGEPGGRLTLDGWSEAERGPSFKDIERIVKNLFDEEQ